MQTPRNAARTFWRSLSLTVKGCLVIGIPITVAVGGFSLFSVTALEERSISRDLGRTVKIRGSLGLLERDLLAMESATRGSILSGEVYFRELYLRGRGQVNEELDELSKLCAGDARRLPRLAILRPAVAAKLKASQALIAASAQRGATTGPDILLAAAAMEKVSRVVQAMDEEEEARERAAMEGIDRAYNRTLLAGSAALSLSLLTSLASMILFTRLIRRRVKALQLDARALKIEAPLGLEKERSFDEIGQLRSELERTSETLAKRANALRASEAQIRALVDNTTAVVYMKDLESRSLFLNGAFEKKFGLKAGHALGRGPVELFGRKMGEALRANDLVVLNTKQPAQFEETITIHGKHFTYLSVKAPLCDDQGEVYGLCGVSTDITDRSVVAPVAGIGPAPVEIRAPLLPPDQVEALGQVAGCIAHDFNNLLAVIIGSSNMLLADQDAEENEASPARRILQAAERAALLTKQLFTLGAPAADRLQVLEVEPLIHRLAKSLEPSACERFIVKAEVEKDAGQIEIDPAQIEHVILNLCSNARGAMPGGGTIWLTAKSMSVRANEGFGRGGQFVAISVRDEGPGIPPELEARMYDPFFTTKEVGGTNGLGLTASSLIAQQNSGWLQCKSEVGAGTTFTLFLPQCAEAAAAEPAPQQLAAAVPLGSRETVLVVEDEPAVAELEALLLRTLGYKVILARDGEAAERAIASSDSIDLVVTDLNMPRINGRQLIERIGRVNPEMKFILTSGADLEGAAGDRIATLSKPFEIKELAEKVRTMLDAPSGSPRRLAAAGK